MVCSIHLYEQKSPINTYPNSNTFQDMRDVVFECILG
jgi:hypothetical protein